MRKKTAICVSWKNSKLPAEHTKPDLSRLVFVNVWSTLIKCLFPLCTVSTNLCFSLPSVAVLLLNLVLCVEHRLQPCLPEARGSNSVGSGWQQTLITSPAFPRSLSVFPDRWRMLSIVQPEVFASFAEGLLDFSRGQPRKNMRIRYAVLLQCCAGT